MLRFKACRNSIVTLELLNDTKTNEKRNVINDKYAKFRCDKVNVINIIEVKTGNKMEKDVSIRDNKFIYSLGEVVEADYFSKNLDDVCAGGIHYFKTKEAALSWFYRQNYNFPDGKWIEWHENGQKCSEGTYKNREKYGEWTIFHDNGQKHSKGTFKNGEFNGKWTGWHDNGNKESEETWKDGENDGKLIWWYENGQKQSEITYKNGERDGECKEWHENGNKKSEGAFKNGKRYGKWIYWDSSGDEYYWV